MYRTFELYVRLPNVPMLDPVTRGVLARGVCTNTDTSAITFPTPPILSTPARAEAHSHPHAGSAAPVFSAWRPEHSAAWGREAACLAHTLHQHPLFSRDALAALIDRCPRANYALVQTGGSDTEQRRWREGDLNGVPGARVIETLSRTSLWLNLRDVGAIDPRYTTLLQSAYDEVAARVPGFVAQQLKMGILISSPSARVHYHCDLPGQALWQIAGRKRVFVYPPHAPFLQAQALENIAYSGYEFKLDYQPSFDAAAQVFELAPGQMLTWPLNAPHRVENHHELNISLTSEHWTEANRKSQRVLLANAVLRHRLGWPARSQARSGPGYWAKVALQAAWRRSPWAARTQSAERPIEFRLAPDEPGGCLDGLGGPGEPVQRP
jgi:hypothetical protein